MKKRKKIFPTNGTDKKMAIAIFMSDKIDLKFLKTKMDII